MLKDIIRQEIERNGFIPVADYMQLCLLHPEYGYYTTQKVFGTEGDFTTAPETSQLFGEMIGVWAVLEWERLGKPAAFNLVELGPGRGTLMRDLLRAVSHVIDFVQAAQIHFVEASPALQAQQKQAVESFAVPTTWHDTVTSIRLDQPKLVIANEFFDALPVRQFIIQDQHWHERVIISDQDGFGWSTRAADPASLPDSARLDDGTVYEQAAPAWDIFADLCQRMAASSGAILVIDYGDYMEPRFGDTLQSLKKHDFVDVLEAWDQADITVHVDFQALENIAQRHDLKTRFLMQREFLDMHGIALRMERLSAGQSIDQQAVLQAGFERLTDPAQMGHLFKVLIVETP
jgi:NADH dehydrogenase [ubiquinone] 1 alpha subcomplex assembly factor 7